MNISNTNQPTERAYTVDAPTELLPFLLKTHAALSRNSVKTILRRGDVSVGGKTVTRHDYPLGIGQTVTVATRGAAAHDAPKDTQSRLKILYEDDELIAVNKPAGLLSIATDNEKTETAYRRLTAYVRLENPENRIFVVHRLDRDTSGVMIAAKNEKIKRALQDNWGELVTSRGYTAVAEGIFTEKSGVMRSWLKETSTHFVYASHRPGDGQEAVTRYAVTAESKAYSLLKLDLETGRKNQIRVQLAELGHPVAGDKKYGATKDPLGRLCLHAGLLELTHPYSGKPLVFQSDVPRSFMTLF